MKLLFLIIFIPSLLLSQNQESKMIIYNVGFGALTSGLGATINKKKSEKWGKTFLRGCWQGSIGGLINYSAKKMEGLVGQKESFGYALPARLINSAGNSIIQNAAANEPFLQNWNFEYGLFRVDFSVKGESKFRFRILPMAVISSAVALTKGNLNLNTTLLTGVMCFRSRDSIHNGKTMYDGINYGRAIVYYDSTTKYHIMSHEVIHEYQYREYLVFNSWLRPVASTIKNQKFKNIFNKYVYPDIPYFGLAYMIEEVGASKNFYRNYFEFEAERMATNKYVNTDD